MVHLLSRDFKRRPIFGSGIKSIFKRQIGNVKQFLSSRKGRNVIRAAKTGFKGVARKVLPLIKPLLKGAIEKGIPILTTGALGAFGVKSDLLTKIAATGSKKLSDALIKRLERSIDEFEDPTLKKKRVRGRRGAPRGRIVRKRITTKRKPARGRRRGGRATLNPQSRRILNNILRLNTTGGGLIEM